MARNTLTITQQQKHQSNFGHSKYGNLKLSFFYAVVLLCAYLEPCGKKKVECKKIILLAKIWQQNGVLNASVCRKLSVSTNAEGPTTDRQNRLRNRKKMQNNLNCNSLTDWPNKKKLRRDNHFWWQQRILKLLSFFCKLKSLVSKWFLLLLIFSFMLAPKALFFLTIEVCTPDFPAGVWKLSLVMQWIKQSFFLWMNLIMTSFVNLFYWGLTSRLCFFRHIQTSHTGFGNVIV